jgi:hypothetical protein
MTRLRQAALLVACFILLSTLALAQSEPFTIGIHDSCDPGTFTAAVGPGTCKRGSTEPQSSSCSSRNSNPITSSARGDSTLCSTLRLELLSWRASTCLRGRRPRCTTPVVKPTPSPGLKASAEGSFRTSISCQETRPRLRSACNRQATHLFWLSPAKPRQALLRGQRRCRSV